MKILLINPPRWNELVGKNPSIIEKYRGFNPPLGLLYLAASIRKNTDFDVEVLNAQPFKWTYAQLENHLKGREFDVVWITAMTFTLIDATKTARLIKKIMPSAKVILGGTHIHLFPSETMNLEGVDYGFMGEAEFSFLEFLKNLHNLPHMNEIPGLIYKDVDGKIIKRLEKQIPWKNETLINQNKFFILSTGPYCYIYDSLGNIYSKIKFKKCTAHGLVAGNILCGNVLYNLEGEKIIELKNPASENWGGYLGSDLFFDTYWGRDSYSKKDTLSVTKKKDTIVMDTKNKFESIWSEPHRLHKI